MKITSFLVINFVSDLQRDPVWYRMCCISFPSCCVLEFVDGWRILITLQIIHSTAHVPQKSNES